MENSNSDFNHVASTKAVVQLPENLTFSELNFFFTLSFILYDTAMIVLFWL